MGYREMKWGKRNKKIKKKLGWSMMNAADRNLYDPSYGQQKKCGEIVDDYFRFNMAMSAIGNNEE